MSRPSKERLELRGLAYQVASDAIGDFIHNGEAIHIVEADELETFEAELRKIAERLEEKASDYKSFMD